MRYADQPISNIFIRQNCLYDGSGCGNSSYSTVVEVRRNSGTFQPSEDMRMKM
jgi:hypothetical protein